MCFNAGKADRIIRVVAGLGLIGFGLLSENLILAAIGAIPLITVPSAFVRFTRYLN